MKNILLSKIGYFTLIFVLFICSGSAQNIAAKPNTKVLKVTVFTDRAMVSSEAVVAVIKGENVIRISGITPNLVDQSVQVSLLGQSDLAISEVAVEETFLKKTDLPEIGKLQAQLDNLLREISNNSNQVSVISSSNDFLKRVNPFGQNLKVTTGEIEAHNRFLEKSLSSNFERITLLESKIKKLNEDKAALENEISLITAGNNKSKTIVCHLLSTIEKGNVKLGFSYLSTQAGWSSQYEARGDFNTSKVEFNYFASIWQSTGEDWRDANIEISTAKPFVYGNISELSPWYVDVFTPRFLRSKSLVGMDQQNAPQAMMLQSSAPIADKIVEETGIQEENTSFTFILPRKADIASDGQPHRVLIAKSTADAKYSWFTVPKLVQNALLRATMKNPFSFPLLSGQMNVFSDQKLVGTASINTAVLPEGELELSLGIDEGIKIERKLLNKYTDYTGILTKEATVNYEYGIDITNGKSKEITLDLNDQFPVSRNEKIRIERKSPSGNEALINEEGKITWKITLAPGAKKIVVLKFSISYPKELSVSGL